jgi:hypothetical protein
MSAKATLPDFGQPFYFPASPGLSACPCEASEKYSEKRVILELGYLCSRHEYRY